VVGPAINWQLFPARVEGVIGERVGRLPEPLRETLKIASVEGEEFAAEVVAQVQGIDARELVRQLGGVLDKKHHLVRGQGVRRLESSGERLSRYRFQHILFQKYLYDSLDEAERAYLHEAVGKTLKGLYREQAEDVALELARHFEAAGLSEQAIGYLRQAGERAVRLSASEAAVAHFRKALALLNTLPGTPARVELELTLQIAIGQVMIGVRGFAAPEVEDAFLRARALCQDIRPEDSREFFSVLSGLWGVYYIRAEYQRGHELAEQLLALAQHTQNPIRRLWAHYIQGETLYNMGEFLSAQTHLTSDLTFYDPRRQAGRTLGAVQDPAMSCLASAALVLWLLGYPDLAVKKQEEALTLARQLNHPFSLVWALSFGLRLAVLRRDAQSVQTQAEVVRLSTEHGFPFWSACVTILRGRAQLEPGSEPVEAQKQAEAGIARIRQGLAAYLATGAKAWQSYFLVYLAEAYQKAGRVEEGLNILAEASAIVTRTGERMYAAEIHRLKGELLLQGDVEAKAEECFRQAIEVARRQQARSWELRATMSLCRLWQTQGKKEDAHRLLAEIYGWFTEGFDTADLQEARPLLEALA
jgi:predicted ATPase